MQGDGETVEIHNVAWQYTGTQVPGRPADERLLLRATTHAKDFVGDIPEPGAVTLEAWPLGVDPKQKPLYSVKLEADAARTLDNCLWVIDRGYVDAPMWSIHRLGDGRHLFDTHVELVRFQVSRADGNPRYAGLDVPADDTPDARLKEPHVVAVLVYAAEDRVLREALITTTSRRRRGRCVPLRTRRRRSRSLKPPRAISRSPSATTTRTPPTRWKQASR